MLDIISSKFHAGNFAVIRRSRQCYKNLLNNLHSLRYFLKTCNQLAKKANDELRENSFIISKDDNFKRLIFWVIGFDVIIKLQIWQKGNFCM
jgi:hypothetical protein